MKLQLLSPPSPTDYNAASATPCGVALAALVRYCLLRYNHLEGLEDELNVIPERSMFYILQIEADLLLHNHVDIVILRILSLLHQLIL